VSKKYLEKFKKYENNYTLALDIGTHSVGWAVLDKYYKIPVVKGNKVFGVATFEQGQTAEERRIKRGARRRIRRRKQRIKFLQEIFQEEIQKNDPNFFATAEILESIDTQQYKENLTKLSLQKVLKYIDTSKEYPTMYHLRKDLMEEQNQFDIRLIYLALHHIVRKRGNFLYTENVANIGETGGIGEISSHKLKDVIEKIYNLNQVDEAMLDLPDEIYAESIKILCNSKSTKNDRKIAVKKINKELEPFAAVLVGLKVKLTKLFSLDLEDELTIDFSNEEAITKILNELNDEQAELFEELHTLYLTLLFKEIIGDARTLSEAKVVAYEKYSQDLQALKKLGQQNRQFKSAVLKSTTNSLTLWEQKRNKKSDTRCLVDKYQTNAIKQEEFYKELKEKLKVFDVDSPAIIAIKEEIEKNTFMKKLNTRDNSAIPHQLNIIEVEKILNNQKQYYPELFTDEIIERIKRIIDFRIPYYVGPLSNYHPADNAGFNWLAKQAGKEQEPIRPWNFTEVVDELTSAENFIERMLNRCTYLDEEVVLAKHSMYYQLFEVLNELNVIKVDEKRISKEHRNKLLPLFLKNKKIAVKRAENELQLHNGKVAISGTQQEKTFATSLSSFIIFQEIFGIEKLSIAEILTPHTKELQEKIKMMENFIHWKTVLPEGEIFMDKVEATYPQLSKNIKKKLAGLKFSGWGRISKKLLLGIPPKSDYTKATNILELMYEGDAQNRLYNFQEIMTDKKFGYPEKIKKINNQENKKDTIEYEDIAALAGSPAIKRGIYQAIKIIDEIENIFGKPQNIVFEMARSDELSRRTQSREKRIEKFISKGVFKGTNLEYLKTKKDIPELNERVMLYIMQLGKCMYTGENLEFSMLSTYEIDHIIPRSLSSDDSMDNKVLVKKLEGNQAKSDYMMPLELIENTMPGKKQAILSFWDTLRTKGLLSPVKSSRLHIPKLSEAQQEGFVNRQLVETRQITKHIITLLEQKYQGEVKVAGIKARLNDTVKAALGIEKIRELNNKHHAVDAYMVGFIYQFLAENNKDSYIDGTINWKAYSKKTMKSWNRDVSWVVNDLATGKIVDEQGEIFSGMSAIYNMICKQIDDTRYLVTRKIGYSGKDGSSKKFWNENVLPLNAKELIGVGKQYLGKVTGEQSMKAALVLYKNKRGKVVKELISIPVHLYMRYANMPQKERENKCVEIVLQNQKQQGTRHKIITVLEKNHKVLIDGVPFRVSSFGERGRVKEFQLPQRIQKLYSRRLDINQQASDKFVQLVNKEIRFLEEMKNEIKVQMSCYYESDIKFIEKSINHYIELLQQAIFNDVEDNIEAIATQINETVVWKRGTDESEKKEYKKLDAKFEYKNFYSLISLFEIYCKNYLFKFLKADAGRIEAWSDLGRFVGFNLNKVQSLILIEESITGIHQRKKILIKEGKVKGEDTWDFE